MTEAGEKNMRAESKQPYHKPSVTVVELSPEERLMTCVKTEQFQCTDWEGNPDYFAS